jgi:hypothetical protein
VTDGQGLSTCDTQWVNCLKESLFEKFPDVMKNIELVLSAKAAPEFHSKQLRTGSIREEYLFKAGNQGLIQQGIGFLRKGAASAVSGRNPFGLAR